MATAAPPPAGSRLIRSDPTSPGITAARPADKTQQYVSGAISTWLRNFARALPQSIDDVTRDFGADVYERMANDPQLRACINLLVAAVLEEEPKLVSPIEDEDDPDYALAQRMVDGLSLELAELPESFETLCRQLLEGLYLGNRAAELVWEIGPGAAGPSSTRLVQAVTRPWQNTAYVVDAYNNTIGLLSRVPGVPLSILAGSVVDPRTQPNLLPREKFIVFTWGARNNDPRGNSMFRPVYSAWVRKQQTLKDYLQYLGVYASPSLVGITAPDADTLLDSDPLGNQTDSTTTSPEAAMVTQLEAVRNGAVIGIPNGADVRALQVSGDGSAFREALGYFDQELVIGTIVQTLATQQAQFGTRAQASVHQDMFTLLVQLVRRALTRCIERDINHRWVTYNFGAQRLRLAPKLQLGETQSYDLPQLATSVAALRTSGYLGASQLGATDTLLGLPQRDIEYDAEHPLVSTTPPPAAPVQADGANQPGTPPQNGQQPAQQTVAPARAAKPTPAAKPKKAVAA